MERRDTLREASKRILDEAARKRRQKKILEQLELDNQVDEPIFNEMKSINVPKFEDHMNKVDTH